MTIAQALYRVASGAGVRLTTHVPGFGASQVFQHFQESEMSYHEEVALGMALGSALVGRPALCLIKMHGLLKAANALVCGLSAGVSAACVIVIFDDPSGGHSDNQLPTLAMLEALEIPVDACSHPQQAPWTLWECLEKSQQGKLPRALLLDSSWTAESYTGELPEVCLAPVSWSPDPVGQLVCPLFGQYQRQRLLARLAGQPEPSPPPLPSLEALPALWQPSLQAYRPWVEAALQSGRPELVAGDTGLSSLFGLEPFRFVQAIGWMGGSLPLALGALAGGLPSAWAVTGDFSFLAAGHLGWQEALRRKLPVKVLLFDNGRAQATGGQAVDSGSLERLLRGPEVVVLDRPQDLRIEATSDPQLYWLRIGPS